MSGSSPSFRTHSCSRIGGAAASPAIAMSITCESTPRLVPYTA